ncbi:MAG: fumarate hydratase [Clostridia bacterium]|jgi:fumarate hydratase subunit alpha|nr:fumarate hydratase [Clostridia bacterium]MCI2001104.1 fumarate hydratase [Clostridia bacterium]MCI2015770.1 fumarate hydratase [Clostridia bacterium]
MRDIDISKITEAVKNMCIKANIDLNDDIYKAMEKARENERSPIGCEMLSQLLKNADIAKTDRVAICQDTGMAVVFVTIGQEVHITGGLLKDAVNEGVRQGYNEGYLRKSVVKDPFIRVNSNDNTPAIIYIDLVEGDGLKIDVAPKGAGSENMSKIFMLKPADGIEGAKKAVLEAVEAAGPNPCPPMIVGVGCGGNFEMSAYLAKRALLRPVGLHSDKPHIREMEEELLEKINRTGIGPQGLGGNTTALAVNIESMATHIACMPVAVNIGCHVTRHTSCEL